MSGESRDSHSKGMDQEQGTKAGGVLRWSTRGNTHHLGRESEDEEMRRDKMKMMRRDKMRQQEKERGGEGLKDEEDWKMKRRKGGRKWRRRKRRRDVASKEAVSPCELCQATTSCIGQGSFVGLFFPPVKSGFLTQIHVFIAKGFFG